MTDRAPLRSHKRRPDTPRPDGPQPRILQSAQAGCQRADLGKWRYIEYRNPRQNPHPRRTHAEPRIGSWVVTKARNADDTPLIEVSFTIAVVRNGPHHH